MPKRVPDKATFPDLVKMAEKQTKAPKTAVKTAAAKAPFSPLQAITEFLNFDKDKK